MENTSKNKAYGILLAASGINFIAGLIYMWSIISKSLIDDLGFTSKEASLPYTTFTISFVVAMVLFGKIQDLRGPRIVASLGCILMGSGLILSGIFTSPLVLVLTVGIITGSGVGILNVSTSPPVVKWFPPEKKGMVTGIVVAGAGLSATMYSPLAAYLIERVGVNKTFIYMGILALSASIGLAQILKNPDKDFMTKKENKREKEKKRLVKIDYTWREMLRSVYFYKLWLMLAFSSSAGLMIIGHISSIADIQADWQGGFILVILISIFNTAGRILGGMFSDKIGRLNLMKIIFILQGLNMLMFSTYSSKLSLSIGVSIAGLCYGSAFSVFPSAISDIYGLKNFGINYGLMFTGWGLGGIIGPMIGASIFDSVNNYNLAYLLSVFLLVLALGISLTFHRSKERLPEKILKIN